MSAISLVMDPEALIAIRSLSGVLEAEDDAAVIRKALALALVASRHAVRRADGRWVLIIAKKDGHETQVLLDEPCDEARTSGARNSRADDDYALFRGH